MATLADYRVLDDGFFELKQGNAARTLKVQLPNNLVKGTDLAQPILAFMVRAVEKAHIRIRANNKEIFEDDFEPSFRRGFWIPFNGEHLTGGTFENEIKFHRDSGRIRIHRVVLWYQLKV